MASVTGFDWDGPARAWVSVDESMGLLYLPDWPDPTVGHLLLGPQTGCESGIEVDRFMESQKQVAQANALLFDEYARRGDDQVPPPNVRGSLVVVSGRFEVERSYVWQGLGRGHLRGAAISTCSGLSEDFDGHHLLAVANVVAQFDDKKSRWDYVLTVDETLPIEATTFALPRYEGYSTAECVLRRAVAERIAWVLFRRFPDDASRRVFSAILGRVAPLTYEDWFEGNALLARLIDPPEAGADTASWPEPRLVKTAAAAEAYAAEVMRSIGYYDAEVTGPGADGGIDVLASEALAQVKMEGVATGRPVVQAIAGIAALEGKRALIFSLAGFTAQAIEWADRAEVACFEFAFDGTIEARSAAARARR